VSNALATIHEITNSEKNIVVNQKTPYVDMRLEQLNIVKKQEEFIINRSRKMFPTDYLCFPALLLG
jgi:hypothetical protein